MNMEKGPDIGVVGTAAEENKEQARQVLLNRLFSHYPSMQESDLAVAKKFEYPKSEEELAVIEFANQESNRLMIEAGIEPYDVPAENFHIIPTDLFEKVNDGKGIAVAFTTMQGMFFNAAHVRDNIVNFGTNCFHELLHIKNKVVIEVNTSESKEDVDHEQSVSESDDKKMSVYRSGVEVFSLEHYDDSNEHHIHFKGLNEAIVAYQEKRSFYNLLEIDALAQEKDRLGQANVIELKNKIAESEKIPVDDIVWVGKTEQEYATINYRDERLVLQYVLDQISEDTGMSQDECFNSFLKAHFTGRLLTIARLIETSFGKLSFRILGNMDTKDDSATLCLETLKKMRYRVLKEQKKQIEQIKSGGEEPEYTI